MYRVFSFILLLSCVHTAESAMGGVYTYPVKSINLPDSPEPQFFIEDNLDGTTEDAHGVHGIEVSDGYIICGGGKERVTKTFGLSIKDFKAKQVSALPNDAFVAKFIKEDGKYFLEWALNPGATLSLTPM